MVGPSNQPWPLPYSLLGNGSYGGSIQSMDQPPPGQAGQVGVGSCNAFGAVQITLTWNSEGDSTNTPPSQVILITSVSTAWSGETGSCDNGIGDPEQGTVTNGTSTGVKHEVKVVPARASFGVIVSPTANATLSGGWGGPPPLASAGVSVAISTQVVLPRLKVRGAMTYGFSRPRWLIGQEVELSTDIPVGLVTSYSWSLPWLSRAISEEVYGPGSPPISRTTGYFDFSTLDDPTVKVAYVKEVGDSAQEKIACDVVIFVPGEILASLTVESKFQCHAPDSTVWRVGEANPPQTHYFEDNVNPTYVITRIMTFYSIVAFQSGLTQEGTGQWSFVQTCSLDRHKAGVFWQWSLVLSGVLDDSFPYNIQGWMPANGVQEETYDGPTTSIIYSTDSWSVDDDFKMYGVFKPPSRPNEPDLRSFLAAIWLIEWSWAASGTNHSPAWTGPGDPSLFYSQVISSPNITTGEPEWDGWYDSPD